MTADTAPVEGLLPRLRLDRHEAAGAFGDLGVLVPIAVAMTLVNGLSATAVFLPAGLLYVTSGLVYRLPVPVQPLKAFGAIAIALQLGADEIAAGSLLMGAVFLALGSTGTLGRVAEHVPRVLIRGVQLSVGLLFAKIAVGLVTAPPVTFQDHTAPSWYLVGGAVLVTVAALALRARAVALVLVGIAVVVVVVSVDGPPALGPSSLALPDLSAAAFATAAVSLVLPQVPLTFANSCLGTADAARTYYGPQAARVTPDRLAMTLGAANLAVGACAGMPVCHGAGGLSAHRAFGARTGGAPLLLGGVLVTLALGLGAGLADLLTGFPLPILAGLLAVAGLMHVQLLRDLRRPQDWALAIAVGVVGATVGLAAALLGGLAVHWLLARLPRRSR
ncbi:putative sulfate/molybdate transporter [Actinotalea sp. C106]|uniref:putative sulfate/molybdate transporter n=1 Tax=Actinotalea sp. C106 TaxID=2908644 RepID=UPI0020290E88|nr:putative sulfate/molybdate transporter [Actinotalea sp. C106]